MSITIRKATVEDSSIILEMIKGLADYEKLAHYVTNTVEAIEALFFEPNPIVHCLIAESSSKAVGFAVYLFNYSTFSGKKGLYLEDFFVDPNHRGLGIGQRIFDALIQIAQEENCGKMDWVVLDWNQPAMDFYHKYGAKPMKEWINYRLNEDQLKNS